MKAIANPPPYPARKQQLAHIIRASYAELRAKLRSPYVGGHEVREALAVIGHDVSQDSASDVSEVLGWREMGLPVANVEGQPRYYFPSADPHRRTGFSNITEQVALCVEELLRE